MALVVEPALLAVAAHRWAAAAEGLAGAGGALRRAGEDAGLAAAAEPAVRAVAGLAETCGRLGAALVAAAERYRTTDEAAAPPVRLPAP